MKFHIENFGCQMNDHDVAKMESLLRSEGLEPAGSLLDADLVIVNTCCIREKAEQKFYSLMGRIKIIKSQKDVLLGVTGCIPQMEKHGMSRRLPFVDFALGPSSIHKVAEAVECAGNKRPFFDFSENGCNGSLAVRPGNFHGRIKANVTIMKGCNNFCSYCIVPYVRGREQSRASRDIMEEIEDLVGQGVKEVTLLGQNVNSYNKGTEDLTFPELLEAVNGINGLDRIRFVTSHPRDMSDELIRCFGKLKKLCESIHLPFQSGSDRVLGRMNRGYGVADYLGRIERLRDACPEIVITADCIVGFPGEEETDFAMTLDLVEKVRFDGIFSFAYSPRKYTAAAGFSDPVPREEAVQRLAALQGIQKTITLKRNKAMEGKYAEVLVEGPSKNSGEEMTGRTRSNKIVNFRGPVDLEGELVEVRVTKGYANSLKGERETMISLGGARCLKK